jgi:hypothetical protein
LVNYAVYGVNGPSSADGTGNAGALDLGGKRGLRSDGAVANLHGSPVGGARLGVFLPFKPHYDLELGVSGQSGEWDNWEHLWTAGVFDAALHLGPNFEAKGEYILTRYGSDDLGLSISRAGLQAGYKLAGLNLELPVINNLELVGRYDNLHNGPGSNGLELIPVDTPRVSSTISRTRCSLKATTNFFTAPIHPKLNQLILQLSYGF